jgi:Zn-dependent protease with chaperone function
MYKLLNFIAIYLLSIVNFAILLIPLLFIFIPIILSGISIEDRSVISIVLLIFFLVNLIVLLSAFLDLLFGFTTKSYIRGTIPYLKLKNYDIMTPIFEEIKGQFNRQDVQLVISDSQENNAFAVGSFKRHYIVLTKGIVTTYLMEHRGNTKLFLANIKCIMGHEMSHLVNRDYLPALLIRLNELATNFLSRIVIGILNMFLGLLQYIPFVGGIFARIVLALYRVIDFIVSFFHKNIILSIYKFFQLKVSRVNEYRCDRQSSIANGGAMMAATLGILGDGGYTTIFSTHPRTKDRMKYVRDIKQNNYIIHPDKKNNIANYIAIIFIVAFPFIIWNFIDIKGLNRNYNDIVINIVTRFRMIKIKIFSLLKISN